MVGHTLHLTLEKDCDAKRLKPEEELARQIVTPFVDGTLCALDEHGSIPTPDFMLVRDGETVGWMEVTIGTDPTAKKQAKALEKTGSSFTTEQLGYDWFLLLEPAANIERITTEAQLLYALALREGVLTRYPTATVDTGLYEIDHPESDAILDDYGIQHAGWTGLADGVAVVRLNPGVRSPDIDLNLINRLAEKKAAAKRRQLDGRQGERHLFVRADIWEETSAAIWLGYEDRYPLPGLPDLPDWVSDVWILISLGQPRLWHSSRDTEAWTVHDVDPAVFKVLRP